MKVSNNNTKVTHLGLLFLLGWCQVSLCLGSQQGFNLSGQLSPHSCSVGPLERLGHRRKQQVGVEVVPAGAQRTLQLTTYSCYCHRSLL
jgi:hypothetical protein